MREGRGEGGGGAYIAREIGGREKGEKRGMGERKERYLVCEFMIPLKGRVMESGMEEKGPLPHPTSTPLPMPPCSLNSNWGKGSKPALQVT